MCKIFYLLFVWFVTKSLYKKQKLKDCSFVSSRESEGSADYKCWELSNTTNSFDSSCNIFSQSLYHLRKVQKYFNLLCQKLPSFCSLLKAFCLFELRKLLAFRARSWKIVNKALAQRALAPALVFSKHSQFVLNIFQEQRKKDENRNVLRSLQQLKRFKSNILDC